MHPDAVVGESQEPFHFRADEMRSAGRGIDTCAHSRAHDSPRTVAKITVERGMMIRILFQNSEMAGRRTVAVLAGRNRTVDHDLLA